MGTVYANYTLLDIIFVDIRVPQISDITKLGRMQDPGNNYKLEELF